MMVEARKDNDREPVADNAASDMSRLADASAKLFAEQASAMAMMTAYGMTVAAQMTGMMLGAFRGPVAVSDVEETKPAEQKPSANEHKPVATVVALRPRAAKAAETKTVPVAEPAPKPLRKAAKPVKAKAAPTKPAAPKPVRRPVATPAESKKPDVAGQDDLKKIAGIGPRLEQELNDRGISRYADIAALSKAAVKKLDAELGLDGRIGRDDWAGQAKALSGGKG
jgi:NADH-quinone oxidoreductase subunit E